MNPITSAEKHFSLVSKAGGPCGVLLSNTKPLPVSHHLQLSGCCEALGTLLSEVIRQQVGYVLLFICLLH